MLGDQHSVRRGQGVGELEAMMYDDERQISKKREKATRAFDKSGIKWSAEMQEKFDNLVEKASSEI